MIFNYYIWYCMDANQLPYQYFITCTNLKMHSLNVPLQVFCVNSNSFNVLLFVMNNRNGSRYIGWDRELIPHVCSYRMIKQWRSIGCGLSRDYISGETICRAWDHNMCHVIRWGPLYFMFTFVLFIHLWRRDTDIMLSVSKFNKLNDYNRCVVH